jgi:nucleoside phosphorylase
MPDQREIQHQQKLLGIYRRNLEILLRQAATYGGEDSAPLHHINQIDEARKNIRYIKGVLRGWKVPVDDLPADEPPVSPLPPTMTATSTTAASSSGTASTAESKPRRKPSAKRRQASRGDMTADVFISYHPADEDWVSDELLPDLENAGLKVIIDYRDFEIGVPRLVNIEKAVDNSRHTLIVMTPAWVEGEWEDFQALLASSSDPKGKRQKLLPLMLKPCEPPSRIAYLTSVDLTRPKFREQQLEKLVETLAKRREVELERLERPLSASSEPPVPARALEASQQVKPGPVSQPDESESAQLIPRSISKPPQIAVEHTSLLDGEAADFVIITALEEERDAVLAKLPGYRRHAPSEADVRVYYSANVPTTFDDASVGTYRVAVLLLLGMGRVQATVATSDAIRRWKPRYVLLVGIAGGIAEQDVKLGDILISDQIVDYELQKITAEGPQIRWEVHRASPRLIAAASDFGLARWKDLVTIERPDKGVPKRHLGPIASGDKVIAFDDALAKYRDTWPKLIGVEMEAGGAAAAAFQAANAPAFFMVRGVSDLADTKKNSLQVQKWRSYACDIAAAYAIALLRSGPVPLASPNRSLPNDAVPPTQRPVPSLTPATTSGTKQKYLEILRQKLGAAYMQLGIENNEVYKVGIRTQIELLEQEIKQLESELWS